jgi:FAD:protein FMN transferase
MMHTLAPSVAVPPLTVRSFRSIGTTATVVVQQPDRADAAEWILRAELDAIDRAASRFRADSELQLVHAQAGRPVQVSPLLFSALEVACTVAERTHGAVDPTVGGAIMALGYDRDFDQVVDRPAVPASSLGPVAGYQHVHLDRARRTVRIPRGVHLDLGSTAKALAADRAAAHIAAELGSGVLVSIGGDVAVAGPPPDGGWAVGIAVESSTPADQVDQVVAVRQGGLASSSASVRTWTAGTRTVHHIVDPRTGDCAPPYWALVSAAGTSCVEANALTTAAVVWGESALELLVPFRQAVRLVRHDGRVFSLYGWPAERGT